MIKRNFLFIAICSFFQMKHASHGQHNQYHNGHHDKKDKHNKRITGHRFTTHGGSNMSAPNQVGMPNSMVVNNGQVQNGGQAVGQMVQSNMYPVNNSIPQAQASGELNNFMVNMGAMPLEVKHQNQFEKINQGSGQVLHHNNLAQNNDINYAYDLIKEINTLLANIKFFKKIFKNMQKNTMGLNNKQRNTLVDLIIHMDTRGQLNNFIPDRSLLTDQGVKPVDMKNNSQNMINPLTGSVVILADIPFLKKYKAALYELVNTQLALVTLWEAYTYNADTYLKRDDELVSKGSMAFYRGHNAMRPVAVKSWDYIAKNKKIFNN